MRRTPHQVVSLRGTGPLPWRRLQHKVRAPETAYLSGPIVAEFGPVKAEDLFCRDPAASFAVDAGQLCNWIEMERKVVRRVIVTGIYQRPAFSILWKTIGLVLRSVAYPTSQEEVGPFENQIRARVSLRPSDESVQYARSQYG